MVDVCGNEMLLVKESLKQHCLYFYGFNHKGNTIWIEMAPGKFRTPLPPSAAHKRLVLARVNHNNCSHQHGTFQQNFKYTAKSIC